jgi:uncharacterized protein YdcH (DUF465 family)
MFDLEAAKTHVETLRREHARLETRLSELDRHLSLSPDEQRERATIKKTKLWLKDSILALGHRT